MPKKSLFELQEGGGFSAEGPTGYAKREMPTPPARRAAVGRANHIYVMGSDGGPLKIGVSNNPDVRRQTVGQRTKRGLTVYEAIECDNPYKVEKIAHLMLRDKAVGGEWFNCSVDEALETIVRCLPADRV